MAPRRFPGSRAPGRRAASAVLGARGVPENWRCLVCAVSCSHTCSRPSCFTVSWGEVKGGSSESCRNFPAKPVSIAAAPCPRARRAETPLLPAHPWMGSRRFLGAEPLSSGGAHSPLVAGVLFLEWYKALTRRHILSLESIASSPRENLYLSTHFWIFKP